jgi:hypothetical protein
MRVPDIMVAKPSPQIGKVKEGLFNVGVANAHQRVSNGKMEKSQHKFCGTCNRYIRFLHWTTHIEKRGHADPLVREKASIFDERTQTRPYLILGFAAGLVPQYFQHEQFGFCLTYLFVPGPCDIWRAMPSVIHG